MSKRRTSLSRAALVVLAVGLTAIWPAAWAARNGGVTALLGLGRLGPSRGLVEPELGHGVEFASKGHDGQQFYTVARHPFDPKAGAPWLDNPAYRYRRILYPLVAGALAPHGGRTLVYTLLGVSMVGVALGAWASARLPGAPPWLPLLAAVTPGVIVSLFLSLSDALAFGLVIAAFALAADRRWTLAIVAATLAALTRETAILAALALALSPGMARRTRVAMAAIPTAALGAWMFFVAVRLGGGTASGSAQQFAFPLNGWIHSPDTAAGLTIAGLGAILLALGAARASGWPAVRAYLVLLLALDAVLSVDVTGSWVNASRVIATGVPLAAWMIFRETRAERAFPLGAGSNRPTAGPTDLPPPAGQAGPPAHRGAPPTSGSAPRTPRRSTRTSTQRGATVAP